MPADNGIYILKTPAPPIKNGESNYINQHGKFEYRVAHCQAIKDLEYSHLYMAILFGNSPVFDNPEDALVMAKKLYDEIEYTEYGISTVEFPQYFPNITARAAVIVLQCYKGAIPLDIQEKSCGDCGHLKSEHAKEGQGRSFLPCEFPNCECNDFIG